MILTEGMASMADFDAGEWCREVVAVVGGEESSELKR